MLFQYSTINNRLDELKYLTPLNRISINKDRTDSKRIIITNNYLNGFNYYNKNNIKMLEFRRQKYLYNKFVSEEHKRDKSLQNLSYTTSYYLNSNSNHHNKKSKLLIGKEKKGNKKVDIKNFLYNIFEIKTDRKVKINYKTNRKNNNIKIRKDLVYDFHKKKFCKNELVLNLNDNKNINNNNYNTINSKNKKTISINIFNEINKSSNRCNDEMIISDYNQKNPKKFKDDLKQKIIFGKTLSSENKKKITLYSKEKNNIKNNWLKKIIDEKNENIVMSLKKKKNVSKNPTNLSEYPNNLSKYSNNLSIINTNSDKKKDNKDLNNISTFYKKEIMQSNPNEDEILFPSIK